MLHSLSVRSSWIATNRELRCWILQKYATPQLSRMVVELVETARIDAFYSPFQTSNHIHSLGKLIADIETG